MPNKTTQEILDITKIRTVEDLNAIDFSKYVDKQFPILVKHIIYPNTSEQLNKICKLSNEVGSKVWLRWSINNCWLTGDLYYRIRALPQIKALRQMPLFDDEIFGAPKKFKPVMVT